MTLFELLGIGVVVATAAVLIALAVVVIRNAPRSKAGELVGAGDFETALDSADTGAGAERDELMAAAFAAKHTMELDRARGLVDRVLADDPADGEAWLERGLIEAYDGDHAAALDSLAEAGRHRADLLESIALHRAWVELRAGDVGSARRRFEEVAAPLRSKFEHDLGPGDPLFSEWFFQAADLWEAFGEGELGAWSRDEARKAAPQSQLVSAFCGDPP
jgi:tetratricopeptide (TPR) repeat protein